MTYGYIILYIIYFIGEKIVYLIMEIRRCGGITMTYKLKKKFDILPLAQIKREQNDFLYCYDYALLEFNLIFFCFRNELTEITSSMITKQKW